MNHADEKPFNLQTLLYTRAITPYFQPIISIRQQALIGFEALARGINTITNAIVMPDTLFFTAAKCHQLVALDRLCREKACENYKFITANFKRALLFFNLEASIIDNGVVGSGHVIDHCRKNNIPCSSVVIEINESKVCDVAALKTFIENHKKLGFLIALDDVGNGHSNLDRILHAKPDIIKIDRCLVSNLDQDYYKQEIFKAVTHMSQKIGALIVAEGIETEPEALTALQLGADMLQGYYFAKPQPVKELGTLCFNSKIKVIAALFKDYKSNEITLRYRQRKNYENILTSLLVELSQILPEQREAMLRQLIIKYPFIQFLYILNMDGIQISDTVSSPANAGQQTNVLYQRAYYGTDQSLKNYYLFIQAGMKQYVSEPYMSLANGKPCITHSMIFKDSDNNQYILCADFNP